MFVDNCSAHPDIQLSHVKLLFLPPNTTLKLHLCDAGITQTVKMHYRKRLARHILYQLNMDETGTASQLAKSVNIMDTIVWLKSAWDVQKCGFQVDTEGVSHEMSPIYPTVLMQMFYCFS